MYTYVSAMILDRTAGAQWRVVDLSAMTLKSIFETCRRIILTVQHTTYPFDVFVDLEPLRAEYSGYAFRLSQWFIDLGDRALPMIPRLPQPRVYYVQYTDAFRAGYKVDLTIIGRSDTSIAEQEERHDLRITRDSIPTPYDLLYRHCLVSVNGYLHPSDYNDRGLYVAGGGRSFRCSRQNQVGLHSFADIGDIQAIPITADQIHEMDPDTPLKTRLYLQLPVGTDTKNKSVVLSLGGYLVMPDPNVFWAINDTTYALSLDNLPYLERFIESSEYLDLSALGLTHSPMHPERVSVAELYSDAVVTRYCTLPQSFWVVVDTPHLFSVRRSLRTPNLPGMFISYHLPTAPLIVGHGKLAEYWKTYEDGEWSLTVQDSVYRHFIFDTIPDSSLTVITGGTVPMQPASHSRGWLLEIGAYKDQ